MLTKILNQRPEDPLFLLESLNRTTQWEWFHPKLDTLRDDPEMQPTYEMAERQKVLFGRSGSGEGEQEMEEETVSEPVGRREWQKEPEWRDRPLRALNSRLRGLGFLPRPLGHHQKV